MTNGSPSPTNRSDSGPFGPFAMTSRRRFLSAAAMLAASASLLGCDPPATRDRQLPSASDQLGGGVPPPEPPTRPVPPPQRVVQRPFPPTSEPVVRVRVATVRPPVRAMRIEGDGSRVLVSGIDGAPAKSVTLPASVESTLSGWIVISAVGTKNAATLQFLSPTLDVQRAPGSKGVRVAKEITGCGVLPWGLTLVARTDEVIGAIDLVCHVPMEQYLPGVLAKELYNSWSLETHTAQAIAARSFACCEIAQSERSHFDVVAGEASQAWIGVTTHKQSLEAVKRTRGMVLMWDRRVVPAYYSSTCGGRPANASDAISGGEFNAISPLQVGSDMVRDCCRDAPAWRWKLSLPLGETAKRLQLWARTERPAMARIDGLKAIDVAAVNGTGRPVLFRLTDSKMQTFEIPAERLRWALNADVEGLPATKSRVKSADFAARIAANAIQLDGRGFGHGVGMCQYGAEALSKKGRTWREILSRYYPGTEVFATYAAKT
jgi:SpoIID/LytB domain protein